MGQRYEKNKKNVSENKRTVERLGNEKTVLKNEFASMSLLEGLQGLLDDEVSESIQDVKGVETVETERIESEANTAEQEKQQIAHEINDEIAKLNAGLEKLRKSGKFDFGKRAIEKSTKEYRKQIDKFKDLMGELGERISDSSAAGEAPAEMQSAFNPETTESNFEGHGQIDSNAFSTQVRSSNLSDVAFSKMNPNRVRVADLAFGKAPQNIVDELNAHADQLQPTMDTGYSFNVETGQRVKDGCYYSPVDHQVRMDETLSDEEYGEILPHELSHFLDHERGWESRSPDFVNAVQADFSSMDKSTVEGRARMNEMLDDAFSTGAAFDRNVSDIISAVFVNDPEIVQRFHEEGVPYYQHSNEYWADPFTREAEIYANNGAVRCSDERISKNFLERYFSNTYNQFGDFYNLE